MDRRQQPHQSWLGTIRMFAHHARAVYPAATLKGASERLLFVVRSLRCFPSAQAWYAWLAEPLLAPIARVQPNLYKKIIRPYLTPDCTNRRKLRILREHHEFVASRLSRSAFLAACTPEGVLLMTFATRDGEVLHLRGITDGKFSKEGELTLVLYSETRGSRISSLTFVVTRWSASGWALVIGGMQGLPRNTHKSVITEVTKSLHGMRPKALLLFAAQQVADVWRLDAIRGVGNRAHVSCHLDYALNRIRRPVLSYDGFWTESGGVRRADGFFDLPLAHLPRADGEIRPNKRSAYRQRYAMLAELSTGIRTSLANLAPREEPWSSPPSSMLTAIGVS